MLYKKPPYSSLKRNWIKKKDILFVFVDDLSSWRFISFALLMSEQVTFASLQGLFWIFRTHRPWIC